MKEDQKKKKMGDAFNVKNYSPLIAESKKKIGRSITEKLQESKKQMAERVERELKEKTLQEKLMKEKEEYKFNINFSRDVIEFVRFIIATCSTACEQKLYSCHFNIPQSFGVGLQVFSFKKKEHVNLLVEVLREIGFAVSIENSSMIISWECLAEFVLCKDSIATTTTLMIDENKNIIDRETKVKSLIDEYS